EEVTPAQRRAPLIETRKEVDGGGAPDETHRVDHIKPEHWGFADEFSTKPGLVLRHTTHPAPPNGLRLSGEGGKTDGVRFSRGLCGAPNLFRVEVRTSAERNIDVLKPERQRLVMKYLWA